MLKPQQVEPIVQASPPAQPTDDSSASVPPHTIPASLAAPPSAESNDSTAPAAEPTAVKPTADEPEPSQTLLNENENVSGTDSDNTAPATNTDTATDSAPATATSHSHSPPAAAVPTSPPLSAAEAAYLARYYSAPVDEHPSVRNLRILTANRIDEVIATSPPFLLYLFDPTCTACALYTPIMHALAYALDTTEEKEEDEEEDEHGEHDETAAERPKEGVRVYVMNDATDYMPGFLSPDEENLLPILKFFPQFSTTASSAASSSFQYTGSPHLSAMVRFLHEQTNGAFDLERALERARSRLPALRAELADKGAKRLQQSEDWALYLYSPCGQRIREYSLAELMSKYVEGGEGEGNSGPVEKYDRFVQCMEEKEEDTMDYFETMAMIANDTLQQLREKREKKRRQRTSEGDTSNSTTEGDNIAS